MEQDAHSSAELSNRVLDSVNAGVYVTDTERRIIYWNEAAQRITGWQPDQILGKQCLDQVLCHIDKDGRELCGEEFCPLHRAITTGTSSDVPIIVFARTAGGSRVPMRVSVAPLRGANGDIVGGVETFQDVSAELGDFQRAQRIQSQCLLNEAVGDARIAVSVHYAPHDMIGGDFCAVSRLGADQYAFFLADVVGHGLSAALYTMYLRSLWDEHRRQGSPVDILAAMNHRLSGIMSGLGAFATAVCGVIDLSDGCLKISSAGGPEPLLFHAAGTHQLLELTGMPMGCLEEAEYDLIEYHCQPGDRLLLFSDGVIEISRDGSGLLGTEGLLALLHDLRYPAEDLDVLALERSLLAYSNRIRFDDDLTILEMRLEAREQHAD